MEINAVRTQLAHVMDVITVNGVGQKMLKMGGDCLRLCAAVSLKPFPTIIGVAPVERFTTKSVELCVMTVVHPRSLVHLKITCAVAQLRRLDRLSGVTSASSKMMGYVALIAVIVVGRGRSQTRISGWAPLQTADAKIGGVNERTNDQISFVHKSIKNS